MCWARNVDYVLLIVFYAAYLFVMIAWICDVQSLTGTIEKEDPLTVRLLFEPSGRPLSDDGDYYTTEKDNICVVCGSSSSYVRKMIVPHEYRKYFPPALKDYMSHDVLLMCLVCHRWV